MGGVATIEHLLDRGRRIALRDRLGVGSEIRAGRIARGVTMAELARRARMSTSQVSRIERGEQPSVSVDQLARLGALVGLDIRVRAYPGADPVLDAAQLTVLSRLRSLLPPDTVMRMEVPLPIPGDQRAWDAVILGLVSGATTEVEATMLALPVDVETRIHDLQAQTRRVILKVRDSGSEHVLLVLADTHHNRDVLRAASGLVRADFPISPRCALAALRRGEYPGGSAIVLL